jgi:N-acetylneuraminic acid mutarotase
MSKPRYSHAAAIADNTLYVFGGQWDAVQFNDMWAFDLKANKWRVLLQTSPYTLRSHSMVFMPACQSLVIFGGQTDQNKANSAVLAYHVGMRPVLSVR